ncbi:MAG: hypothetical protein IJ457_00570 [Clostridia bacterium]|nr:hypothetical protein [Clostridia bacterium]
MDERIKMLLEESSDMTKEELVQKLHDIFGDKTSEIDKWYAIGKNFWLRRTTASNYFCVQVLPIMVDSYLCYLHVLDIGAFEKRSVERYRNNVNEVPEVLPADIQYVYPVAISQDTDNAAEMFLAPTAEDKNGWLHKMGIQ